MNPFTARALVDRHRKRYHCSLDVHQLDVSRWRISVSCRRPGKSGQVTGTTPDACYVSLVQRLGLV
jgi:hypothetical protein